MLPGASDGLRSQPGRGAASGLSALARLLLPNDAADGAAGAAAERDSRSRTNERTNDERSVGIPKSVLKKRSSLTHSTSLRTRAHNQ